MSCSGELYDCRCHDTDRACSRDQDILAQNFIREGCMRSISKWIKDCIHLFRNCRVAWPYIGGRNYKILGKCSVSVNAHAFCILTVFLMPFQTVPALAASNMAFAGYQIPNLKSLYAVSYFHDLSNVLVSCSKANRNCMLCPIIPLVNMYICSTNRGFVNLNLNIIRPNFWNWDSLHP